MKQILIILTFLLTQGLKSQENIDSLYYAGTDTTGLAAQIALDEKNWTWTDTISEEDFAVVDAKVAGMTKKYKSISELSKDLSTNFPNDQDYVRAAFRWITSNISYDYELANDRERLTIDVPSFKNKSDELQYWKKYYFKYAEDVLVARKGVCEGYSSLFYELCKAKNIQCKVIHGKAADSNSKNGLTRSHAWNKVFVGGNWVYLDATMDYYFSVNVFDTHTTNESKTKVRNNLIGNF